MLPLKAKQNNAHPFSIVYKKGEETEGAREREGPEGGQCGWDQEEGPAKEKGIESGAGVNRFLWEKRNLISLKPRKRKEGEFQRREVEPTYVRRLLFLHHSEIFHIHFLSVK